MRIEQIIACWDWKLTKAPLQNPVARVKAGSRRWLTRKDQTGG